MRRTDAALDAIAHRTAAALSMAGVQPRRSGTSVLPGPGHYAPATIPLSGVRVTEPASRPTERLRPAAIPCPAQGPHAGFVLVQSAQENSRDWNNSAAVINQILTMFKPVWRWALGAR